MKSLKRVLLVILILAPALALLFLRMRFALLSVPTSSMENTILIGDHLIVHRMDGTVPHRGEIVVFRTFASTSMKRVVAIAGDRVRIHEKKLYINGQEQTESYVRHIDPSSMHFRDEFPDHPDTQFIRDTSWAALVESSIKGGEVAVPAGKCFVLGDNRDNSLDSRYLGFIPENQITGEPVMVLFSVETDTQHISDPKGWRAFRWPRFLKFL